MPSWIYPCLLLLLHEVHSGLWIHLLLLCLKLCWHGVTLLHPHALLMLLLFLKPPFMFDAWS
jgi:hypothetical protein